MIRYFALAVVVLVSFGCAHHNQTIQMSPNKDVWIGRSEEDVTLHPIFATMPVDSRKTASGGEVRTFKNSGGTVSNKDCTAKPGYFGAVNADCAGTSREIVCNHVFILTSNKVANYTRVGQCTEEMLEMRPRNLDGTPVLLKHEMEQYRTVASDKECKETSECSNGQSCKEGTCKSLGLWGRLFN